MDRESPAAEHTAWQEQAAVVGGSAFKCSLRRPKITNPVEVGAMFVHSMIPSFPVTASNAVGIVGTPAEENPYARS